VAKNLSRKYATMSEDERHRFRVEESEGTNDRAADLDFEEPRENEGPQYASIKEEFADPGHRDGMSAVLDDEAHKRAVEAVARKRGGPDPDREPDK
jgi:hypothetical protein